jgi:hypothetical protein
MAQMIANGVVPDASAWEPDRREKKDSQQGEDDGLGNRTQPSPKDQLDAWYALIRQDAKLTGLMEEPGYMETLENYYIDLSSRIEQGDYRPEELEALRGLGPQDFIGSSSEKEVTEVTQAALENLAAVAISGTSAIDSSIRPEPEMVLENISLIIEETSLYDLDTNQIAYILATAHWESGLGGDMTERWDGNAEEYFRALYWDNTEKKQELGNLVPSDAEVYFGRGFVQLTGRANYQYMGEQFGVDLIHEPNHMYQDRELAAKVLVYGMVHGTYTGMHVEPGPNLSLNISLIPEEERKSLFSYNFPEQFLDARAIIGAQDAEQVAAIAREYACVLQHQCQENQLPSSIQCADAGC